MRGFTLIEVLVASFIIMLGVTGYVTLQSQYMRTDSDINLREIALKLAQDKVDDLRQFDVLDTTAGVNAYADIDDNAGGDLASGLLNISISADNQRIHQFNRVWTVTEQYFVDTNGDGLEDSWLDEGDVNLPPVLPAHPSQKQVTVSVSWLDIEGDRQTVALDTSLAPVPMARSFQATNETDNAKQQPQVAYTPGHAPDVIAYDLGNGENIETSKPVPDIDNQGDNNIVQFETIRYVNLTNQTDKLEQEDFLTVNCSCTLAGSGTGYTPSMTTIVNNELAVVEGEAVTKMTGKVSNNQQPDICNACCRDHHDTSTMIAKEQFYRLEDGGPHKHYKRQSNGSFVMASSVGDQYDEICRFKRVDGYFELYPDWQLLDIVEFDDKYLLDSTNLTAYTGYTEALIKSEITGTSAPSKLTNRDITVAPGGYQMIARGIYLDRMTGSHIAALKTKIAAGESDWKALVPFYDINLTLLTEWSSQDQTVATITNQPIQTIVDPVNDFYGTYSRGRIEALIDGTSVMSVLGYAYNASITGTGPISQDEVDTAKIDDTLTVTVDSKSASEKFYGLIGNINCLITIGGVTESCETNNDKKSSYVDLTQLQITSSPAKFTCPITVPKGKSTPFFSCTNVSENYNGTILFALSKPGFTTVIKIQYPDGSVVQTDALGLAGLAKTSNQEYSVILELTEL